MWLWPATEATQGFVVVAAAGLKIGSDSFPLLLPFTYFKTEPRINCGLILRFLKLERRARLLCRQRRLLFPASGISSSWGLLRRLTGEFSGAYLESSLLPTWRIAYLEDCLPGGLYLEDRLPGEWTGKGWGPKSHSPSRAAWSEQKQFQMDLFGSLGLSRNIYLLQDFSFWPCGSTSSRAQCRPVIKMFLWTQIDQEQAFQRPTDRLDKCWSTTYITLTGGATYITLMKYRTWPILDS